MINSNNGKVEVKGIALDILAELSSIIVSLLNQGIPKELIDIAIKTAYLEHNIK